MQILFMDNTKLRTARNQNIPKPSSNPGHSCHEHNKGNKPNKPIAWNVFLEQSINSIIVGGIAGISALAAADPGTGWRVALIAFGLTALTELRKYRNL